MMQNQPPNRRPQQWGLQGQGQQMGQLGMGLQGQGGQGQMPPMGQQGQGGPMQQGQQGRMPQPSMGQMPSSGMQQQGGGPQMGRPPMMPQGQSGGQGQIGQQGRPAGMPGQTQGMGGQGQMPQQMGQQGAGMPGQMGQQRPPMGMQGQGQQGQGMMNGLPSSMTGMEPPTDARRAFLMSQLANKDVGAQPGPGRMPTMDEQFAAGQAGRAASPPNFQNSGNSVLPDYQQMAGDMRQMATGAMRRPNPAGSLVRR